MLSQTHFNFQREGRLNKYMSFLCTVRFPWLVFFLSPSLVSDLGSLVQAMGAMRVVVAAARVAAGEVVVGALVPIL